MIIRARSLFALFVLMVAVALSLQACVVESEFELLPYSRLPVWLELPKGVARSDVRIRLTSYLVGKSKITMHGPPPARIELAEISGSERVHPITGQRRQQLYPAYWIFSRDGREELIEIPSAGHFFRIAETVALNPDDWRANLKREFRLMESALAGKGLPPSPDDQLNIARVAFEANEYEIAVFRAQAALTTVLPSTCCIAALQHSAHIILGRSALRSDRLNDAIHHLSLAGQVSGSPSLSTFGPNMALAKELLERGQSGAVLKYLDDVKVFWHNDELDNWKKTIRTGNIPDFGENLVYGM